MIRLLVAAVVLACTVTGCATGPIYTTPAEPPSDHAVLVIYRLPTMQSIAWATDFLLNDKPAASLRAKGYTWLWLKQGRHVVRTGRLQLPVQAEAGKSYFVRYSTQVGTVFMTGPAPVVQGDASLTLVPAEAAVAEVAGCHYTAPTGQAFDGPASPDRRD